MNSNKIITIVFYIAFVITGVVLFILSKNNHQLLVDAVTFDAVVDEFTELQKNTAIINIVSFSILTIIGLWAYRMQNKVSYLLLSLILYTAITLYNFVTLNKQLYALKVGIPSDYGAYWLMTFIGVFYIIGAVVVAAIGYITVKNYMKRRDNL